MDPSFGVGAHLDDEVGAEGQAAPPCAEAAAARPDRQGWTLDVRLLRWSGPLTYRVLGPSLDRGDVHALAGGPHVQAVTVLRNERKGKGASDHVPVVLELGA